MRWTRTLIPTMREAPAEASVPSHQLMLRAGLVQQAASGSYSYLPLGWRVLHKICELIREEMDRAGAAEVFLPALQPIEWWEQTGRREDYGENLFVVNDRHGRDLALGPTHEEVMTQVVGSFVHSYRQLPLTLYQIQTKFRDEYRPRFGVLRSREFQMKDAYSFDLDEEGLDRSYRAMYDAYCRIFDRCGVPYVIVDAETGEMGGSASQQFTVPAPTGEDVIFSSDKENYAANRERCEIGERPSRLDGEPTGTLETVHTPGCSTIEQVTRYFRETLGTPVTAANMLKTLVCRGGSGWVVGVVRGDHELNPGKLQAACGDVKLAEDTGAVDAGFAIGYVGPQVAAEREDVTVVVDPDAAQEGLWITGANAHDQHVRHFNWKRDVVDAVPAERVRVADLRNAEDGDRSPMNDGGVLRESRGIEVGQVFKLGVKYTEALDVSVLDAEQKERRPIMGCYGIGVNRILAAAIEAPGGHDDAGVVWPKGIAPYQVIITPIRYEGRTQEAADTLYEQLGADGIEVLLDDRGERPGVKFNDADLVGIPLRVTVGEKGLKNDQIEVKRRTASAAEMVPRAEAVDRIKAMLQEM